MTEYLQSSERYVEVEKVRMTAEYQYKSDIACTLTNAEKDLLSGAISPQNFIKNYYEVIYDLKAKVNAFDKYKEDK